MNTPSGAAHFSATRAISIESMPIPRITALGYSLGEGLAPLRLGNKKGLPCGSPFLLTCY
jgi:hypothetical protein